MTRDFQLAVRRLGLPQIRFHDLRHTCATLLAVDQHPKHVQELLGHSQISLTLDTYSHTVATMHDRVAMAMEDLLTRPAQPSGTEGLEQPK